LCLFEVALSVIKWEVLEAEKGAQRLWLTFARAKHKDLSNVTTKTYYDLFRLQFFDEFFFCSSS